jgi:RNA recognition motif-containing protein
MSNRVFVGNLAFKIEERELRDAFAAHGAIKAEVVRDKYTGNSRGFGFVEFADEKAAADAAAAMNGEDLGGRPVRVEIAKGKGPNGGNGRTREHIERFRD